MSDTTVSAASRLAALRQHPEVRLRLNEVLWYGKNLGLPTGTVCEGGRTWRETFDSEVDALLAAVAAAATAQTLESAAQVCDWVAADHLERARSAPYDGEGEAAYGAEQCAEAVRALAGGAPPPE